MRTGPHKVRMETHEVKTEPHMVRMRTPGAVLGIELESGAHLSAPGSLFPAEKSPS